VDDVRRIGHEDGGYTRVMYFTSAEPRRVMANAGTQNALQVAAVAISDGDMSLATAVNIGRAPTRAELNAARRAAHSFASTGRARVLYCRVPIPMTLQVIAAIWCWPSQT
jgi:hypothetical protein